MIAEPAVSERLSEKLSQDVPVHAYMRTVREPDKPPDLKKLTSEDRAKLSKRWYDQYADIMNGVPPELPHLEQSTIAYR